MNRNLIGQVTLPRRVFRKLEILPWATEVNRALQELRDRLAPSLKRSGKSFGKRLPFEVEIFNTAESGETPVYKVRVHPGYVNERIPGEGTDQTVPHLPGNLYVDPPPTPPLPPKLAEFAVEEGDGVYVSVGVDADGKVAYVEEPGVDNPSSSPVTITIAEYDPGPDSVHYQPKVDDETPDGATGIYKYKLAEVQAGDSGGLVLKRFLAGSHISHFQELPSIKSTMAAGAGIGVIPKKWDDPNKCYKLRALTKGLGKLNVTTNADEIEVRGNKQGQELVVYDGDDLLSEKLEWRDGLLENGQTIEGDEDPPATITDPFEIYVPTVKQRDTDAQVNVSLVGAVGKVYQVEGNGVDAYLEITVNGDPGVTLEVIDGLVTDVGGSPLALTIPSIPNGSQGDMLYWNVVAGIGSWTLLTAPAAPASGNRNFLTHDGTVPSWIEMEGQEIQICDGGTPVTKTIYTEP